MIFKIKQSLESGVEKAKWFSGVLAERMKAETAVIKLMARAEDLEKKKDGLHKAIGLRVFELRVRKEANVLKDPDIKACISEIEALESEIGQLREQASQIGRAEF